MFNYLPANHEDAQRPFVGVAGENYNLRTLLAEAMVRTIPKRTLILRQGERSEKFLFIVAGWVKLYSLNADGEEVLGDILGAGDILGDLAFFYGVPNHFFAVAIEDTQVGELSAAVMKEKMANDPEIASHLMRIMTRRIYTLRAEHGNLALMDAPQKLSCLLLRLSAWMKGCGGSFPLPYDKSIVAAQLGMEPSTLSRTFTKLEDRGVTCAASEIHIQSFSFLSKTCCRRCPIPEGDCAGRRYESAGAESVCS